MSQRPTCKERSELRVSTPSRCIQSRVSSFVVILRKLMSTVISQLHLFKNLPALCLHH
jgi:hypothetical protein